MSHITLRRAAEQARSALKGWANHGLWAWPESALQTCKQNTEEALAALDAALAAPRLEVTVDPRLTAEEAAAISAAIDARKKEQSEDIEALRRDAERYRWLRERAWFQFEVEVRYGDSGETVQELDAAIDAAMGDKR